VKASRKFLIGFGIVIVIVVGISVALALVGGSQSAKVLDENTPEGTVQRYLLAVKDQDYPKAYSYLSPNSEYVKTNPYDVWIRSMPSARNASSWKAGIVKSNVKENDATVDVVIDVFRADSPLSNPVNTNTITFVLHKENGKWLINTPVDLYWLY
jgi:hypothetical protein